MVLISDSKLTKGETYTLYINGVANSSQELTSTVTSNGNAGSGMQGGMQKQNGKGQR